MPQIAPPLIAGLSHVTLLLYTILCSILSFWTSHRVRLASSASPFDEVPALTEKRSSIVRQRHKNLSFSASRFPLSRRTSSASIPDMSDLAGISPPPISPISIGRSRRKPPPPLNLYGIATNYYSPSSPSVVDDDVSSIAGSLLDGMGPGDSGYWLEDEDSNSPTGSLLDDKAGGWLLPAASEISVDGTHAGRRTLCVLALLRAALVAPVVYEEVVTKNLDVSILLGAPQSFCWLPNRPWVSGSFPAISNRLDECRSAVGRSGVEFARMYHDWLY